VLLTYLYYGAYKLLLLLPEESFLHQNAALVATLVFYSVFDHPHIFQTLSRTHADSSEFARHKTLYTYGLLAFILSGYAIKGLHLETPFEFFFNIYGIWHILRQNSGFLRLYKKKAGESSRIDSLLDYGVLYGCVILFLAMRLSDTSRQLLLWVPTLPLNQDMLHKLFGALIIIYGLRQLHLLYLKRVHLPKLLFLFAIISTYYFTYVTSDPPFGLLVALETIYHDVQYQGWIIHFQKRRFDAHSWKKWFASSLAYGLGFGVIFVVSMHNPMMEWLLPPFIMLVLFHYFIDGKIWRFSKGPELKKIYKFDTV
jgi:hypothetical protein